MDSRAVSFGGMAGNAASEQDLALASYAQDIARRQAAALPAAALAELGITKQEAERTF